MRTPPMGSSSMSGFYDRASDSDVFRREMGLSVGDKWRYRPTSSELGARPELGVYGDDIRNWMREGLHFGRDIQNHKVSDFAPQGTLIKLQEMGKEGMDLLGRFDLGEFGDPRSDAAEKKLLAQIHHSWVAGRYYEPEKAVRPGSLTPPRGTPSPHYPAFMSLSDLSDSQLARLYDEAGGEGPTKLNPYLSYEPKDPAARGIPPGIHKHELEEGLSFEERAKARKNRAALRAELGLDYYGPDRVVREHPFKPETWSSFKDWAEKKNIQVKPWDNVNDMQYLYDHWAAENPDQYRNASVPRSPGPPSDALLRKPSADYSKRMVEDERRGCAISRCAFRRDKKEKENNRHDY